MKWVTTVLKLHLRFTHSINGGFMSKERFEEIQEEMCNLANEAMSLLPTEIARQRASVYWFAHIMGAIGGHYNTYMGGSMITMSNSLESFDGKGDDDEN